jgi:dTDP-4-dehydrorhamnose 3,5-epimerase
LRFVATTLPGVWVLELAPHCDDRGFFARTWCAEAFRRHGLHSQPVQTNLSSTRLAGTVRGLHYQRHPAAEAKLVRCLRGGLFDVALDLRPTSPTRGRWFAIELTADNRRALYVPEGCAHGFQALTDHCEAFYQVSHAYAPEAEAGVRYDDPAFAVAWPLTVTRVSPKDAAWPDFPEFQEG